jgi:hypothetical protein
LIRALGLAHYWQRLLDEGKISTIADIAQMEGMDVTQVRRLIRLTLLAPVIVEQLVEMPGMLLEQVIRRPHPLMWTDQIQMLTRTSKASTL